MDDSVIRRFEAGDEVALADIMHSAIRGIGPRAYDPRQVEVWAGRAYSATRYLERVRLADCIMVAAMGAEPPVAYVLIEPDGHVDHLYCAPEYAGRGLGIRLLDATLAFAREHGIARLYTEASELARPVFERAGYVVLHRRDFDLDSVPIHNFAMERTVAP